MSEALYQTIGAAVPRVTAVIPTFNRPEFVTRAVYSALRQTVSDIEVVVVIDGPDQATERTLGEIGDERLRVVSLPASGGANEARNCGVRASMAEWIAFLDDDDEWLPDKIEKQLRFAEDVKFEFPVICSMLIARSPTHDQIWPRRLPGPKEPLSEYLFCQGGLTHGEGALQTSTILTRRGLLMETPMGMGLKRHQDWDWILRVSTHPSVCIAVVPEPLCIYSIEGTRPSIGRETDFQFSLDWAAKRRDLITPKAYSFFIATQCVTRARKSKAGIKAYFRLAYEFLFRGSPRLMSCVLFVGFLMLPHSVRRYLRDAVLKVETQRVPNRVPVR